jgi:hypothetical protein
MHNDQRRRRAQAKRINRDVKILKDTPPPPPPPPPKKTAEAKANATETDEVRIPAMEEVGQHVLGYLAVN